MSDWYIEKDGVPVKSEMLEAAKNLETNNRTVGLDKVGDYRISTVFLTIDHSFGRSGPPLLYETMVFNDGDTGNLDLECERYSTRKEALAGHRVMVEKVKNYKHLQVP